MAAPPFALRRLFLIPLPVARPIAPDAPAAPYSIFEETALYFTSPLAFCLLGDAQAAPGIGEHARGAGGSCRALGISVHKKLNQ